MLMHGRGIPGRELSKHTMLAGSWISPQRDTLNGGERFVVFPLHFPRRPDLRLVIRSLRVSVSHDEETEKE